MCLLRLADGGGSGICRCGAGSLDELFEVLTWRQLGLHEKPVYLLNINGYWQPLLALIDHMILSEFADISFRDMLRVEDSVEGLIGEIEKFAG